MGEELWPSVRSAAIGAGLDAVGVASARPWTSTRRILERRRAEGLASTMQFTYRRPARSTEPGRILTGARSIIVAALSYGGPRADHDPDRGPATARVARYAAEDHYRRLRDALGLTAAVLRGAGHRAVVVADDNALVDREAAWRAGLGWYGRNSLILLPGHGSWFVLGSIVTDAVLAVTGPPVADGCGTCDRCLIGCPTGAIVAPGVVDARRCLSWILQQPGLFPDEFRRVLGDRVYGCDDCQEVCPPSRVAEMRITRRAAARSADGIDIAAALGRTDAELMAEVPHWYVPGRDGSVIRRNLLIVAGNVGRPHHAELWERVDEQRTHHDAAVVDAAEWALAELRRRRPGPPMASVVADREDGRA